MPLSPAYGSALAHLREVFTAAKIDNARHLRPAVEWNLVGLAAVLRSNEVRVAGNFAEVRQAASDLVSTLERRVGPVTIEPLRQAALAAVDRLEAALADVPPDDEARNLGLG